MPDHVIEADQTGAYNIHLDPETAIQVKVEAQYATLGHTARVFALSGTTPIYVRPGADIHVGDPKATLVPISTWADIPFGATGTLSIISADAATVSVARA